MLTPSRRRVVRLVLLGLLLLGLPAGCSRTWYRRGADSETYGAIQQKGGYLDPGTIYPPAASRLHDPYSADCPPMPPDDPRSHQLMHFVDGKKGYRHWDKFGRVDSIESERWRTVLPRGEEGEVELDLRSAIEVGKLNSREFQRNLEILYLSALDVTLERFQFDYQLFAGNIFSQDFRGRSVGRSSETQLDSFAVVEKTYATGAELVVGLANSLVWDAWGEGTDSFSSTLDFALRQPLLRFGGRARVLEQLTQSERDLLANVRQMTQYRQGFYVNLATGRNSGSGPSLGGRVGQSGLGLVAGFPSGRNGAPSAGGYLGLLQDQQEIRNQEANVAALRDSAAQLEAAFEANRITSRLQVDQARQALLNAQSDLLSSRAGYDSRVDEYKITLGLPPDVPLEIGDPLLDRFQLIDPRLTELQNQLSEILLQIRQGRPSPNRNAMEDQIGQLELLDPEISRQTEIATEDLRILVTYIPQRRAQLERVAQLVQQVDADVDARVFDVELFEQRVKFLQERVPAILAELAETRAQREALVAAMSEVAAEEGHRQLVALATRISDLLLELSLVHAEIKLQGIALLPIELEPREALEIARINRLDWMNARANLVDAWRKIEFFANELKSDLDVIVDGQLGTRPGEAFGFTTDEGRVRMSLEFDSPTTRLIERNRYRIALINYQQARRDYMLFEDRVSQSLRNTIRIIKLSQINLEVRRAAVQVAIAQVDIARLSLNPPVRPNQPTRTSPTAARDLVSALTDLLNAQNDLLNVWVSYEVLRVLLDFEMGTMQLDPSGVWIDPGPWEAVDTPQIDDLEMIESVELPAGSPELFQPAQTPANGNLPTIEGDPGLMD